MDYTIVCFLDVLGYKKYCDENLNDINKINILEKTFNNLIIELPKHYQEIINQEFNGDIKKEVIKDFYEIFITNFKARFISDSIILTLKTNNNKDIDLNNPTYFNPINMFFFYIRNLYMRFVSDLNLFLRGGVAYDLHYEQDYKYKDINSLFIFSKAFIKAYEIEKSAINPRIVLDPSIINYLKDRNFPNYPVNFFNDRDDLVCIDLYAGFVNDGPECKEILDKIEIIIKQKLSQYRCSRKIYKKFKYFYKYHLKRQKEILSGKLVRIKFPPKS